jgi:hypothetical protein
MVNQKVSGYNIIRFNIYWRLVERDIWLKLRAPEKHFQESLQ